MFIDGKEIRALRACGKVIQAVYYGVKKVWEAIRSCFGAGYWDNDQPWDNDDAWVN
jgi:hypothetical protein